MRTALTRILLGLVVGILVTTSSFAADANRRTYNGAIEVPSFGELDMSLIVIDEDGGLSMLLTVPLQGVADLAMQTTVEDDLIVSTIPSPGGPTFRVRESDDRTRLIGEMEQRGMSFSIEFERADGATTFMRPQEPQAPFPYRQRELVVRHPAGHLLAGTMTLPKGRGPFPCAVLISGSGMQDRDESLMGHKPFLVLADYLTRRGIAVMRFDDRGVGASTVEHADSIRNATSEDFATDVAAIVNAVRWQPEINDRLVGLIGHSEGGLIGPMVAAADDDIAFVVMLAGPGVPGSDILLLQQELLFLAAGASQEQVDHIVDAQSELYTVMESADESAIRHGLRKLIESQMAVSASTATEQEMEDQIDLAVRQFQSPWMTFFRTYDPAPTLGMLDCPVLAMNGTLDLQVWHDQNLPVIEQVINDAGGDVTIVRLEGLNHLFQPATTGAVGEYATIETTIDESALQEVGDWVNWQVQYE
ncbi:MAG: alpha/beta fold hydrolase [Phycisphaerales bacterium]|nr:alpha/beta fold hydrolase [Phycisphaerales bacterium]